MHTFFAALFFILGRRNFIFHRFKRIKHCIHLAPDASTKEFDAFLNSVFASIEDCGFVKYLFDPVRCCIYLPTNIV